MTLRSSRRPSSRWPRKPCWLATVDPDGVPSVTPKELFSCNGDDTIAIAEVASAGSLRNIRTNPSVCVSILDVFRQRGFKITGTASILSPEDPRFTLVGEDVIRMAGQHFPVRHVIEVKVRRLSRIWAPSYSIFPERTEQERMAEAYHAYGVMPFRDEPA